MQWSDQFTNWMHANHFEFRFYHDYNGFKFEEVNKSGCDKETMELNTQLLIKLYERRAFDERVSTQESLNSDFWKTVKSSKKLNIELPQLFIRLHEHWGVVPQQGTRSLYSDFWDASVPSSSDTSWRHRAIKLCQSSPESLDKPNTDSDDTRSAHPAENSDHESMLAVDDSTTTEDERSVLLKPTPPSNACHVM